MVPETCNRQHAHINYKMAITISLVILCVTSSASPKPCPWKPAFISQYVGFAMLTEADCRCQGHINKCSWHLLTDMDFQQQRHMQMYVQRRLPRPRPAINLQLSTCTHKFFNGQPKEPCQTQCQKRQFAEILSMEPMFISQHCEFVRLTVADYRCHGRINIQS